MIEWMCKKCGSMWAGQLAIDVVEYCPSCGEPRVGLVSRVAEHQIDDFPRVDEFVETWLNGVWQPLRVTGETRTFSCGIFGPFDAEDEGRYWRRIDGCLGSQTLGSQTLGSQTLGSQTLGSGAPKDVARYRPFQVTVVMGESNFGNPEPRLEFVFPEDSSNFRTVQACLYLYASWLELHAREDDPFVVVVDQEKWNVHLELAYDPVDRLVAIDRGMAHLRSVADDVDLAVLWIMGARSKGTT